MGLFWFVFGALAATAPWVIWLCWRSGNGKSSVEVDAEIKAERLESETNVKSMTPEEVAERSSGLAERVKQLGEPGTQ